MASFAHHIEPQGDDFLVLVSGDLDAAAAPGLRAHLNDLVGRGAGNVLLDLRAVTFMDSVGLGTVVKTARSLTRQSRRLQVVRASPQVERVLELGGFGVLLAERA